MRTALLAAYHISSSGELRAELTLAGRSVIGWQIALVQNLKCERIIVLTDGRTPAIVAAQHQAQASGLQFHCLQGFERLPAMLKAEDELLILADGLIGDCEHITALLMGSRTPSSSEPGEDLRKVIICRPCDSPQAMAFPEDFERIDAARCWAGALLMRAAPIQRLSEFPAESNAVSLLLRLALQAGTPCVTLTSQESAADRWLLAHDRCALAAREHSLIMQHRHAAIWSAPMLALAERLVAALGAAALARGEPAAMVAGALALLATLALAMLGLAGPALGIAAAGSFAFAVGARFARLKTALLQAPHSHTLAWLRDPGSDALVSVALALALAPPDGLAPIAALGPLAIGAARLAAASPKAAAAAFWRDRTVQLALIALAASFGLLGQATALMALSALAQVLFTKRDQPIPQ